MSARCAVGRLDPEVVAALRAGIGAEAVLSRLSERLARAHDASIYRLVPLAVVRPRDVADLRKILAICREFRASVTFRAAGTSLSGQAVTDGILVELGPHWGAARVEGEGESIVSQPGVTGGRLNALLARYRRRIGPDPASLAACMIGGIVANNASGMCCGTHENSYKTLKGLKVVLADGYLLDTGAADADDVLARDRPQIHAGLSALRARLHARPELMATIARKYRLKNTMGYGLNAFADFERPADILAHLLVGSEGTLGFIAEVTLRTVAEHGHKATAIAYFTAIGGAGAAVEPYAAAGATVLELMDARSLEALADEVTYPFALTPSAAALLVEVHADDAQELAAKVAACRAALPAEALAAPVEFTEDAAERARYWRLRKGLFPKVGARRRPGTAVVIEDICLPRSRLAAGVQDLRALLARHGFDDAVIFGHARDGNLHFVLCNDFGKKDEVLRYTGLMDELASLVVDRYDGSLKAEHGTGRNMAPFVRREWGDELYAVMLAVKALLDPDGILNPGVLLNADPQAHVQNLKALPAVAARVDQCIECGFCEAVCPSRDLTLTPRQRIALRREMALLGGDEAREIAADFAYAGVKTCAGDGMCASVCPVGIDTGAYMRELKAATHGPVARWLAGVAAQNVPWLVGGARLGLRLANVAAGSGRRLPLLPAGIPLPEAARRGAPPAVTAAPSDKPKVVYFSACLGGIMDGSRAGAPSSRGAVEETLALAGFAVLPATEKPACCGQAFLSKAYDDAARVAAERLIGALWRSTAAGEHPVVCDTSPCSSRLWTMGPSLSAGARERWQALKIYDFPSFMAQRVLPTRLAWPRLDRRLVLHPTCSSMKHGTVADLVAVARAFATEVEVPAAAACCGFAGDKGFQVPELTRSATRREGEEVRTLAAAGRERGRETFAYSTCQTCAYGMEAATGMAYESIAMLCRDALRQKVPNFSCENVDRKLFAN